MTCITHKADDVLIDIQLVHNVNNKEKGKVHGTHRPYSLWSMILVLNQN